ncbi:helix-turn-helix domain-containing protein [Streptomyces sp. NPDC015127]|uniref:AlbA family DNA-binding domain-containing protein n=1 Tax=Streptomyces sp. NPDC015127 TaxID=3364939 RepID=UPI00370176C5
MQIQFNRSNNRLELSDGWSTTADRSNEFDVPRDRVGEVTLHQIRDFLRDAGRGTGTEDGVPASFILFGSAPDGIRVYGENDVRYEILGLLGEDQDRISLILSVDYVLARNRVELDERLTDYFTRRGVEVLMVRFCGPAESIELHVALPLDWTVLQCAAFSDTLTMLLQNDRLNLKTPAGAYALVGAGAPAMVLGEAENEWLEVKRESYGIAAESQKYEFACDVASFANSDLGGLIVIGIASSKDSSGNDVLARVTPCRRGSLNVQRYMQILRDRVIPPVEGLRIDVVPVGVGDVMAIYVPPQPEEIKPFIVKGAVVDSKVSGSFLSIPHRRGSDKWAMSPEAVHSMLVAARVVLRGVGAGGAADT